jgi:hypothetical protein
MGRNTDRQNHAQEWNAGVAQGTADKNTDLENSTQKFNQFDIPQQQYNNRMGQAGLNVQTQEANQQRKDNRRNQNIGFFGNALTAGALAYGGNKKP